MNPDTPSLTERAPSLDRDGRAAYRVPSTDWSVSTAVVEAVAEVADRDPLAENFVLYDAIDPDALDCIFADHGNEASRTSGRVVFDFQGCRVEVHADGDLVVFEPSDSEDVRRSSAQSV
ncbi:HalOD1 output domain-containing protein [Halorussus aquaticus]|uniref:HalOD1 output domain-containing protein n=1 Tax=Halorussus aquaticus TaxID=2953748 RepID=A0ABD5PZ40_9EURY|nr:HalOD1 output domain-containing protein [Halorussus aquaticus]